MLLLEDLLILLTKEDDKLVLKVQKLRTISANYDYQDIKVITWGNLFENVITKTLSKDVTWEKKSW